MVNYKTKYLKYKLKLEKLKQKGGMFELNFNFDKVQLFPSDKNDENIENDETLNVYSKILEENRAQYNKKKNIYDTIHIATLSQNYDERKNIFSSLPDSPIKDLYYKTGFKNFFLNDYDDVKKYSDHMSSYQWLSYHIANIPYNFLKDDYLLSQSSNYNFSLKKIIDSYQFTLMYRFALDKEDMIKLYPRYTDEPAHGGGRLSPLFSRKTIFIKSKNIQRDWTRVDGGHVYKDNIIILYQSQSELYTWRFFCSLNGGYTIHKPCHYVLGSFIHIELQKFINDNYNQIPIASNFDNIIDFHNQFNISSISNRSKDSSELHYSKKEFIKIITMHNIFCELKNKTICDCVENLFDGADSATLDLLKSYKCGRWDNSIAAYNYLDIFKKFFVENFTLIKPPVLFYSYNLTKFDTLHYNSALTFPWLGEDPEMVRDEVMRGIRKLSGPPDETFINFILNDINYSRRFRNIDVYKMPIKNNNNDIIFEYYFIKYECLINKFKPEQKNLVFPYNINEEEFNFYYEWKTFKAPYFIIPENTEIDYSGIYKCNIENAGLYFCKVLEYSHQIQPDIRNNFLILMKHINLLEKYIMIKFLL